MSIADRIQQLTTLAGGITSLAKAIEVNQQTIRYIISGRSKPSYLVIRGLAVQYPTLNLQWLILGEGPMWEEASNDEEPEEYKKLKEENQRLTRELLEAHKEINGYLKARQGLDTKDK